MKKLLFAALAAASAAPAFLAAPALAQDTAAPVAAGPETPSDTRFEPYVSVLGGRHDYDRQVNEAGVPPGAAGWLVQGIAGVNFNAGPVLLGVEGNATKGVSGDIDWEYGVAGRVGVRAGKDSLFFGKVGYQWVNFDFGPNSPDRHGTTYGAGLELSLADMGMAQDKSPVRLRFQIDTMGNFTSIRPMAGLTIKY